jgi:hypothetical protein
LLSVSQRLTTLTTIANDNQVYAWGQGYSFQLGNSSEEDHYAPIKINALQDKEVIQIAAGENFSVFLSVLGEVHFCGQLVVGTRVDTPTLIVMGPVIRSIDSGLNHVVALSGMFLLSNRNIESEW